ncbi:hypothetical protein EDC01DRAFT_675391 [Geopyxis carbonaria]|nr:hypothetical protein EDC01DRAFT_675391 [Geopyxis carbonaria]
MAAEVATGPSQTSAGAAAPVTSLTGLTGSSSRAKSPGSFNLSASSSIARASSQNSISESQLQFQSQYKSTASPSDDSSSSTAFFSASGHHQLLSPGGTSLVPLTDRNVPRGLPPMSAMSGTSPTGMSDPRAPMSPRSMHMALNQEQQNMDALSGDPTAPRKRSKVSRACDECRRKKIRCDATSESGIEQCSSCKRVGSKCSFSRVPMKRGPSKG